MRVGKGKVAVKSNTASGEQRSASGRLIVPVGNDSAQFTSGRVIAVNTILGTEVAVDDVIHFNKFTASKITLPVEGDVFVVLESDILAIE